MPAGRKSRNLGRRGMGRLFAMVAGVSGASPAVEDTVEVREGGGEGEESLESCCGMGVLAASGDSEFLPGRFRVDSAVPGVLLRMIPLAFIVSLWGRRETMTVLQTASKKKKSWTRRESEAELVSVSTSLLISSTFNNSASFGLEGMMALKLPGGEKLL